MSTFATRIGAFMMMVAVGWIVLEETNSPISLGLVWAVRSLPHFIWGLIAGAIADRSERKRLLILAQVAMAMASVVVALLVSGGMAGLWHVLTFTFVISSLSTFATTSRQALIVDLVGRDRAMRALSLNSIVARVTGVVGGVASGMLIAWLGPGWVFFLIAVGYLAGAIAMTLVPPAPGRTVPLSIRQSFVEGITIIRTNRLILLLVVMAIVCEILGFSWQALLPLFARDILDAGATGLGVFSSSQSLGGVIAVLGLASLGDYRKKGKLILGVFLLFGVFLVLFAASPWYATSIVLCGLVGAMAAAFDTLQHTMLQLGVQDGQRGRAMGIWLLSIGFGPLGSLGVGAMAAAVGARTALTINGAIMVLVFVLLALLAPRLRRS